MTHYPKFKVFTMLKNIPEMIVSTTSQSIDGVEHIKVSGNGFDVDPEFWIGKSLIKSNSNEVKR